MSAQERNLTWQHSSLSRTEREHGNGHRSLTLWFTGLSGAGKSSLAFALERRMHQQDLRCYVLDGDNVRHGLNKDLGFNAEDRQENLRRIGEVSKLMVDAGLVVLSAFISPNAQDREMVRQLFEPGDFVEIYVRCSIEECERRDPKGLYKRHATVKSLILQAFQPLMTFPLTLLSSLTRNYCRWRTPWTKSCSIWSIFRPFLCHSHRSAAQHHELISAKCKGAAVVCAFRMPAFNVILSHLILILILILVLPCLSAC